MATRFILIEQFVSRRDNKTPVSKRAVTMLNTQAEQFARYRLLTTAEQIRAEREKELQELDGLRTQNMRLDEKLETPRLKLLEIRAQA